MTARPSARAVREHVLDGHATLLAETFDCADAVANSWDGTTTSKRGAVVGPFAAALDRARITDRLPAVLVDAVGVLGEELPSEPVAAPPYVAITSVGPVLRATLDTERLVITIRTFEVERDPTRYARRAGGPADALRVELKSR